MIWPSVDDPIPVVLEVFGAHPAERRREPGEVPGRVRQAIGRHAVVERSRESGNAFVGLRDPARSERVERRRVLPQESALPDRVVDIRRDDRAVRVPYGPFNLVGSHLAAAGGAASDDLLEFAAVRCRRPFHVLEGFVVLVRVLVHGLLNGLYGVALFDDRPLSRRLHHEPRIVRLGPPQQEVDAASQGGADGIAEGTAVDVLCAWRRGQLPGFRRTQRREDADHQGEAAGRENASTFVPRAGRNVGHRHLLPEDRRLHETYVYMPDK